MRILHVLGSLQQSSGGPLRAVLDLSGRGFEHKLHSEIVGIGPLNVSDNPFPTSFIHSLPPSPPHNYLYCRLLRPWLRDRLRDFDGVVIHGMWQYPSWAAAQECLRSKTPYACFPHGMLEPWSIFGQGWCKALKKTVYWKWREVKILQKACHVFFTSTREMSLAQKQFSLQPNRSLLIPDGAMLEVPQVQAPSNCQIIQPADRKVALFLGRLHPKKNVEFLISSWAEAAPPAQWHLVIAGPGDRAYVCRLRRLVERLQICGRVHFTGYVDGADRAYLFQRADWFLLPSLQENFGIAVLEAVSCGCPVIISDRVYIGDYFDSYQGILPLDVGLWAEFIRDRMVDSNFRDEAIRYLRSIVERRFPIESIARDWATQLTQVFLTPETAVCGKHHSTSLSLRSIVKEVRKYNRWNRTGSVVPARRLHPCEQPKA